MSVRRPAAIPVGLSTASCYPDSTPASFEIAHRLGYDGVEIMVATDPVSQHPPTIAKLVEHYDLPVLAVHVPCLLITQRVWGSDPIAKLRRSVEAAELLDAPTVVLHPPLRWQRAYARELDAELRRIHENSAVRVAMENMFPLRARGRAVNGFLPHWDVSDVDGIGPAGPVAGGSGYDHFTLDLSHTATAQSDALTMLDRMGDRLRHIHLADGTAGANRDEHLVPGRGDQPCAQVLRRLAERGLDGSVVIEISTRKAGGPLARETLLTESLAFARRHLRRSTDRGRGAARPRRVPVRPVRRRTVRQS